MELRDRATRMAPTRLDDQTTPYQVATDLAPKLGVKKESLRRWIIQAQIDQGLVVGTTSEEREETKRLKKELREANDVIEVLKAASVFFAGEPGPRKAR